MTREFRLSRRVAMIVLTGLLAGAPAFAQDPEPQPSPEPEAGETEETKVEFSAYVDAYYFYNFNEVDPLLHVFEDQHNTITLSLAQVSFEKPTSMDSRVGFRTDLIFGPTADIVASFEPPLRGGSETYKNILQAYGAFQASESFTLDIGKFVTPIGAEVIQSGDNWNYSRSILFGFAIPFYHVGVRGGWQATDSFSLTGFLVNGWNNSSELNGGKSVALAASVGGENWSWIGNVMTGDEPSVDAEDEFTNENLTIWDTTLSWDITSKFSVMGNADYGTFTFGGQDASWGGFALYARLQAKENWWLAGRYEWIDDPDGFMTIGQKAQEITITSDHVIAEAWRVRFEYRTDFTKDPYFPSEDGTLETSQTTLSIGVVYGFTGKI